MKQTATIPDSVTSIGAGAFDGCASLRIVTIPKSAVDIGKNAFPDRVPLTDVYYGGSKEKWSTVATANGNDALRNAVIHYNSTCCVLRFDANGGTGEMDDVCVYSGDGTVLPKCVFVREGFDFTGWNTQKDGKGTSYADEANVTPNNDLTFYAQWKEQEVPTGVRTENGAKLGQVKVKWSAAGGSKVKYTVYRVEVDENGNEVASTWTKLKTVNKATYTDKKVESGKTYRYYVAVNYNKQDCDEKTASNDVTVAAQA